MVKISTRLKIIQYFEWVYILFIFLLVLFPPIEFIYLREYLDLEIGNEVGYKAYSKVEFTFLGDMFSDPPSKYFKGERIQAQRELLFGAVLFEIVLLTGLFYAMQRFAEKTIDKSDAEYFGMTGKENQNDPQDISSVNIYTLTKKYGWNYYQKNYNLFFIHNRDFDRGFEIEIKYRAFEIRSKQGETIARGNEDLLFILENYIASEHLKELIDLSSKISNIRQTKN